FAVFPALRNEFKISLLGKLLNSKQSAIAADWPGTFLHQLHTVVVNGIMAGGYFDTTIYVQIKSGKIQLFCAGHDKIYHITAGVHQPFCQCLFQILRAGADIAAQHYLLRLQKFAKSPANPVRYISIKLLVEVTADI